MFLQAHGFEHDGHGSVPLARRNRNGRCARRQSAREALGERAHAAGPQRDAFAADQDDQDQDETDPELPILRGQIGNPVLHQLEDHGSDQPAVEIAGAADDEHEQEIGGAFEGKYVERGKGGGLRQQRAGNPGVERGEGVDGHQPRVDRNADRGGAQRIALHRPQRQAERGIDDAPRQQKKNEQHDQAVGVGHVAEDIEVEHAENGRHDDALQPIGAAGDARNLVGDLTHDERDAERHHQPREVGAAQNEEARCKSEDGGANARHDEREHRLVDNAVLGQQRGDIGAQTEEGGMAERYDAGVAEDEVEREREQTEPRDLGEDQVPPGQQEHARERGEPKGVFERAPAGAPRQAAGNLCDKRGRHRRSSTLLAGRAGEQALRTQDQNDDHDGVDDEGPEFGDVILARDVGDADQQRGGEGTGDARRAADRHHDQEVDHVFEREGRIEAENFGAERAAESREARSDGKRQAEDRVDVDAEPAGNARVVDRGAQPAAETGAGQNELQADREHPADHDDEQPVASDADAEDLEAALQYARDLDEDLLRAHHVVDRGDRHEDEADGEQHLVEVALAVDVHVERALEQRPDERGGEEGDGKPGEERRAGGVTEAEGDVAPRHGERAVGEI